MFTHDFQKEPDSIKVLFYTTGKCLPKTSKYISRVTWQLSNSIPCYSNQEVKEIIPRNCPNSHELLSDHSNSKSMDQVGVDPLPRVIGNPNSYPHLSCPSKWRSVIAIIFATCMRQIHAVL